MKILHVSDTHGNLPELDKEADIIVHSGDFLPTKGRRMGERIRARAEFQYQRHWVSRRLQTLAEWIGPRPFLLTRGNHDFYNAVPAMRSAGIDAIDLSYQLVEHRGVTFYGFPPIPFVEGEWAAEMTEDSIAARLAVVPHCDILVPHCPPYGVLDVSEGRHLGSEALLNWLTYGLSPLGRKPRAVLCGHIHSSHGVSSLNGIVVSNSATVTRMLTVPEVVMITV